MTTKKLETRNKKLESRVLAMASEIAELRERQERMEIDAAVRLSEEQIARGEAVPAREALEKLRKKLKIPAK